MSNIPKKKVLKNFFDESPITKKHFMMILIIAIAFVFEQADNYNFTYVAPALRETWGLSVSDVGKINTWFAVGMLIGSFIFGIVSDRYGRKKALMIASCVFSTFSLLNGLATTVQIFTVMRFLTGIGICGVIIVAPTYLVEILPAKNRGRLFSITLGCGYLGIPLIAIVCNVLLAQSPNHWRYVYILGSAGFLIALLSIKFLQESPRWLVSKGHINDAEKTIEAIVGEEYICDLSNAKVYSEKYKTIDILKIIFSKRHIKDSIALLSFNGIVLPTGLIFVNNSATILLDRGFSMEQSMKLATLLSIGLLGGPIVASFIGDFGGRKWPIALSCFCMSITCIAYGVTKSFSLLCVLGILFSVLVQIGTVMASNYGPELYPTKYRNAATGMVGTLGRICAILVMAAFPILYDMLGFKMVYIIIGLAIFCAGLSLSFLGRTTGGVTLENIGE